MATRETADWRDTERGLRLKLPRVLRREIAIDGRGAPDDGR
jgi:hypothetical protein